MENSAKIFEIALGLEYPWFVSGIRFEEGEKEKELHISLDFKRGSRFKSSDSSEYKAYDTVSRSWQHLNFFQHKCFLHARVPRVKQIDGKVKTVSVPWARKYSGFTLLFEAYSMLLIEHEMPVKDVAEVLNIYPQRLWNIFSYWIEKAHKADEIKELHNIGIDETSSKKGHNYVTTMVDMGSRRVLYASEGKGSDNIKAAVKYLENKSVDTSKIEQVCIDMSPAFWSGCEEHLPQSEIIFDKFHVIKAVNEAMDDLRRLERKGNEMLKGHKYTFLKNKLHPDIENERDLLLEMYPKLGEGYRLVQMFKDFWDIEDIKEAEAYLSFWCDFAMESNIFPFQKVVNTIKTHWWGILNYIKRRITNGILEGINAKIQLAKRRARGYTNIESFINMIYFTCGKLNINYPLKVI